MQYLIPILLTLGQDGKIEQRLVSYQVFDDGRVEVTVKEEDLSSGRAVQRTYRARSMQDFVATYPDLSRRTGLDLYTRPGVEPEKKKFEDRWEGDLERRPQQDPLRLWLESERRQRKPDAERGGFGISAGPISETLAAQLKIREGAVILDVEPDSDAEKAGLRRHDVIVAVDGRPVTDLIRQIREAREGGFTLDIIRGGRAETIEVP